MNFTDILQWVSDNKEWIFGGIGVSIVAAGIRLFFKKVSSSTQIQKSGKNSKNIQAGRDINVK